MIEGYTGRSVLIDTHVLFWASLTPEKLSVQARRILESGAYEILVSVVSIWEAITKTQKGQMAFQDATETVYHLGRWAKSLNARWLGISQRHMEHLAYVPLLHKDPFDRMLLSQAEEQKMPLITIDREIHRYTEGAWPAGQKPRVRIRSSTANSFACWATWW